MNSHTKVNALPFKFFISSAVAALVASSAFGMDVTQCSRAMELGNHGWEGSYENLGSSLVLFESGGYFDGSGSSSAYFVNCKSGETIRAIVSSEESGKVEYDHQDVPKSPILEMVQSPTAYSFFDVLSALKRRDIDARLSTSNEEICACLALYLQDRGSKKKYVFQDMLVGQ
jgi:hypothetical protein